MCCALLWIFSTLSLRFSLSSLPPAAAVAAVLVGCCFFFLLFLLVCIFCVVSSNCCFTLSVTFSNECLSTANAFRWKEGKKQRKVKWHLQKKKNNNMYTLSGLWYFLLLLEYFYVYIRCVRLHRNVCVCFFFFNIYDATEFEFNDNCSDWCRLISE